MSRPQEIHGPQEAAAPGAAASRLAILMLLESGYGWNEICDVLGADESLILNHLDGYRRAYLKRCMEPDCQPYGGLDE